MYSPSWQGDTTARLVIAGPWLIYALRSLIQMIGQDEPNQFMSAADLLACVFGAVAGVSATVGLRRTSIFAFVAALVFLSTYFAKLAYWTIESDPAFGGPFERFWLFYKFTFFPLLQGSFASGIGFIFADLLMPVVQIAIVVLFMAARPNQALNAGPERTVEAKR